MVFPIEGRPKIVPHRMPFFHTRQEARREPPDVSALELYVGKGARLHGEFHVRGTARIDGYIEGTIWATGNVYIGKDAVIVASIRAENLWAQGPIRGEVHVRHTVELRSPATVEGSIRTHVFRIEDGVAITGQLSMGAV